MVKVVLVGTNATSLKGHKTGLWLEELASPYYLFVEKDYEVIVASPAGGPIPIDEASLGEYFFTDPAKRFMHDATAVGKLGHSIKLSDVDLESVDGIFFAGGHGAVVDFVGTPDVKNAIESMYRSGKVVAAVCHGVVCLTDCVQEDGTTPLIKGKTVAGFSNTEEDVVQLTALVPFSLEDKLKELGGKYEKVDDWNPKVCVDQKLVTGQNPQSSEVTAKAMIELLE
uniref:DJ-1/PfpI domain-containing protein n=1 Tax=Eucampia antarctica TaxID=49252 RepID=A0A7S2SLI9_9STRA|mmetsp:Transcript_9959/g.9642  ORF Transcript_9959/g.9642 Transcript_9959/m.9642 type:complete len:226 (+) Transcript_9959:170-847(+)